MIRAAALSYAIVFSLLIGLICSGVLFVAAAQKKIEITYTNSEAVLLDSYAAIQYGKNKLKLGDSMQLIHPSGDTSKIKHIQWGLYDVVTSETFKKSNIKKRCALLATPYSKTSIALQLPGNMGSLKITGNTRLEGTVIVPNGVVEQAYISGKNYTNDQLVYGSIQKSETGLPALHRNYTDVELSSWVKTSKSAEFKLTDSSYSFLNPTTFLKQITPILIDKQLSGNIVIQSFDSIYVAATAKLEHVILNAPIVRFEKGFKGSVQVIANEQIVLEEGVQLSYPSALVLNENKTPNPTSRRSILLQEGAQIRGGVLLTSQLNDFRKMPYLDLKPNSLVAGMVYNTGESQIMGTIIGSLYTQSLSVSIGGGVYGNHLVDAIISTKRLPKDFCSPNWLAETDNKQLTIIEWL
jgi:hypothetical protein